MIDIKITIAAPELTAAINNLAGALMAKSTPVAVPAPKAESKPKPAPEAKTAKAAPEPKAESKPKPAPAKDQPAEADLRAKLKKLAIAKARLGDAQNAQVKNVILETGADKLSSIPADKLLTAIARLEAI